MNRTLVVIVLVVLVLGGLFFALRPAPQEEAGPQENTVDLVIQGDMMTPDEVTFGEGDSVTLNISTDNPIEFHMHGYDLEQEVTSDEPVQLSFEADLTGQFEIEDEETQTELGTLIVEPR